jgi:two-component system, cell cycle sensor histidine kinase and response regulator CckA
MMAVPKDDLVPAQARGPGGPALLDSVTDPWVVVDRQYRVLHANEPFAAVLGTTLEHVAGNLLPGLVPGFANSPLFETIQRVLQTRRPQETDDARGGRFYHLRAYPTPPDAVLVIQTDVTPRRQLEDELLQTALRSQMILQQLPAIHWTVDRDLRILVSTGAGLANLGLTPGQLEGVTLYEFLGTTDPTHPEIVVHQRALAGERVRHSTEYAGRHYDSILEPLRDGDGRVIGAAGLSHDVTELRHAESERQRLQGLVCHAQKMESLGVLAGGVAHDFNNLLTGILGTADLLLTDLPPDSPHRPLAGMLKSAGERAADLTRQMLTYAGRRRALPQLLDLNRCVAENLPLLSAGLSKNIQVRSLLADRLPPVQADPGQVQQVVMNLLLNAAEALEPANKRRSLLDGPAGIITLTTGVCEIARADGLKTPAGRPLNPGRHVFLEVADTGCGMTAEVLARIFDPFFTTKPEGRGLGLSAVLGIVESHRGAIQMQSAPGTGSTFRVLLPAGGIPPPVPTLLKNAPPVRLPHAVVLLIDDEAVLRDVAGRALTAGGLRVLQASGGQEGLELFQAYRDEIALVLLDRVMPGLDSTETLAAIRQVRPDVKVLLMSGYDRSEALRRFREPDLAGFLQKPYTLHTLLDAVGRALSGERRA